MAERYRSLVYYRAMIEDAVRTGAYQRAIQEVVRPGQVVLDLGTGVGILACFAARAGAKRVYAVEATDIIDLAQQIALENRCNNILFLQGWSTELTLPERVDCVVTETLGGLALDENILRFLADARERFLKPGGTMIPQRLRLFLAAVESPQAYEHVSFWDRGSYGLHFQAVARRASKTPFMHTFQPEELISDPVLFRDIDLYGELRDAFEVEIHLRMEHTGTLHGWAGWFEVDLTPQIRFGTGPMDPPTHWEQVFFPCVAPLSVHEGETVALRLRSVPRERSLLWYWELI